MNLQDLLEIAAKLLGLNPLDNTHNFDILFRCANLALTTITSNYISCTQRQTFDVRNNTIEWRDFEYPPQNVRAVTRMGFDVPYHVYTGAYITVPNGKIAVIYNAMPQFTDLADLIAQYNIPDTILLYGILAEYSTLTGLPDEAKLYTKKMEKIVYTTPYTGRMRRLPI